MNYFLDNINNCDLQVKRILTLFPRNLVQPNYTQYKCRRGKISLEKKFLKNIKTIEVKRVSNRRFFMNTLFYPSQNLIIVFSTSISCSFRLKKAEITSPWTDPNMFDRIRCGRSRLYLLCKLSTISNSTEEVRRGPWCSYRHIFSEQCAAYAFELSSLLPNP